MRSLFVPLVTTLALLSEFSWGFTGTSTALRRSPIQLGNVGQPSISFSNPFNDSRKSPQLAPPTALNTASSADASNTSEKVDINFKWALDPETPSFPVVLWKFTRPHTIIGSALAIPALHILAAPTLAAAFTGKALSAMAYAMVPALLMNLYITGLNQITDVEIDKINKPNLPIAAGHLTMRRATITVVVALVASLMLGVAHPTFGTEGLNAALWLSGILGTVYSLPPFRLKRFPLMAAFCIVAVRGAVINASFFAHSYAAAYGGAAGASGSVIWNCLKNNNACFLSSAFFGVFGLVIALMKDVPDVKGDAQANVRTLSVRLGQKTIYTAMRRLLSASFFAVGAAFLRSALVAPSKALMAGRIVTSIAAVAAAWSTRKEAQGVDPENSLEVYNYYMHLWKLFYLSYLVLPFAR